VLEFAYNNSVNPSTKHTPFFLNTGRHPTTPATLALPLWIQGPLLPGSHNDFARSLPAPLAKCFCQVEFD
jgi:hypothetical protein